jgi:hypothetical protein
MEINQMIELIQSGKIKNKKEVYIKLKYRNRDYTIDITDIKIDFIKYNLLHISVKPYVIPVCQINNIECDKVIYNK